MIKVKWGFQGIRLCRCRRSLLMQWTAPTIGIPMSAFGYKRTFCQAVIYVRFTPESGRSCANPGPSSDHWGMAPAAFYGLTNPR